MTHQEYNTLMRLIDLKAKLAILESRDLSSIDLEEEIDELESVLRAHLCEED